MITRCDFKLIPHNAVRFDNWVVSHNLNSGNYVKSDGTVDLSREKGIVRTSRGIVSKKICNGFVGKIPQYVTFTCSYCHLKGKLNLLGKMFGLCSGLLEDKMDRNLIVKDTWESFESMLDSNFRLDAL